MKYMRRYVNMQRKILISYIDIDRFTFDQVKPEFNRCISDTSACDHVDLVGYSGTQTMAAGHSCQRWDSQFPHTHANNLQSMFPDASVADASNYCRNPDGADWPWCYTVDTRIRYAYCKLPDIPCGKHHCMRW